MFLTNYYHCYIMRKMKKILLMSTINHNIKAFEKITLFYLVLPIILFLVGWVNIIISIPIVILYLFFFFKITSYSDLHVNKNFVVVALISFFFTFLSGIGELGFQFNDYEKHNSIYKTLLTNDSPVFFKKDNKVYMLCYYLAYYIPTTFFAKLVNNIGIAPFLSFLWGWLGVALIIFWLFKEGGIKLIILFFFIGGFSTSSFTKLWDDKLLYGVKNAIIYTLDQPFGFDTRIYLGNGDIRGSLSYLSNLFQLFWSPQHSIGAWLCGIILYKSLKEQNLNFIFLSGVALFFWSPMVFIGAIPFYIFLLVKVYPRYKFDKLEVLLSLITFLIILLFFKAHLPNNISGFVFKYITSYKDIFKMILFIGCELGIGIIFLTYYKSIISSLDYEILLLSFLLLCIIPFYTTGLFNDFVMRASTIPLFYFTYLIGKYLIHLPIGRTKMVMIIIAILGFYESFVTLSTSIINLQKNQTAGMLNSKIDIANYKIKFYNEEFDISDQYLGYTDSFFCKYLAK